MKKNIFYSLIIIGLLLASCGKKVDTLALELAKADSLKKAETTKDEILGVARIEPQDGIINLYAGTNGKILSVLFDENQVVTKGNALATVEVSIENAQLNQAESRIGTQEAAVKANAATIEALKVGMANARETYNRNTVLFEGKALTKQILDDSKAILDRYEKDIETADANKNQTAVKLKEIQADINYYKTVINQKQIKAPLGGRILKVNINPGDYVTNTTNIADFAPAGSLIAKTEVDELYADRIVIGQKGFVISQTTGDTLGTGTVSFAAAYLKQKSLFKDQSTEQEDRRVREVHLKIESGKPLLIGSRVDCIILLK